MSNRAEASFRITGWEETDLEDDGVRIYRTEVTKTFSGEVEGTSRAWLVMATTSSDTAAYCGIELLEVSVQGRKGTFLLKHDALGGPEGQEASWVVVPGSGTGELAGLAGIARIDRAADGSHAFTLILE